LERARIVSELSGLSRVEPTDQPSGSNHIGSEGLGPLAQRSVRGNQCHLTSRIGGDRKERVVTAAGRMHNCDAVGHAWLDASASLPFKDHDDRLRQSSCPG
jgi:hypothetical protein